MSHDNPDPGTSTDAGFLSPDAPAPEAVRAAVFDGPDAGVHVDAFPRPDLAPGAALVRINCCTVCGSDVHTYTGNRIEPTPAILGHEMVGRIAAIGGTGLTDYHGEPLAVGDRVTWSMQVTCGDCFNCTHGIPQKCTALFKYGHAAITERHALNGGLTEACHLRPGTTLFRVPEAVPDVVISPANCATATVAGAVRLAGGLDGQVVLVQGVGMLGLTAIAMADAAGATAIIALERQARRREWARAFGATEAVDPEAADADGLEAAIRRHSDGRGADVLLELTGHPDATERGLAALRTGGTGVLVGPPIRRARSTSRPKTSCGACSPSAGCTTTPTTTWRAPWRSWRLITTTIRSRP
ncbi:MAG: alcohol dehydrogenase catalytic domain-containing protein [Bacteroidetes bacterium]|jgi:alcohol dehydrogenase|nr:alcohol dehydrogenase catalytic domain-containing protein [Bacteroidota bacterium]